MSVSGAMSTAVSGLVANSTAVARISENIANSNTIGYKRTFASMVTQTVPGAGSVSGVAAVNGSNVDAAGMLNSTGNNLDLGVSGTGFFVVSKNPNDPLLSNYFLTRAGEFRPDKDGYMVNSAGYYLAAYELDDAGNLGAVDRNSFSGLQTVKVGEMMLPAEPSTQASVKGNLPAQETGTAQPGSPFLSSMEFYTQLGRTEKMTLSWQPTTVSNEWRLTLSDGTGVVHGTVNVAFHNSGDTPGAPLSYTLVQDPSTTAQTPLRLDAQTGVVTATVVINGEPTELNLSLGALGSYDGIQQFVGDFTPQKFTVNGAAQTELARSETDRKGVVWGIFDDGRRKALYEIPLAQVTNANGLTQVDGNAYQVDRAAGHMVLSQAGTGKNGTVNAGTLEASTVEIATELTDLIRVQRAYSSNAKIITTADEMLQEVTQLKR